jgi:hypothetical protein
MMAFWLASFALVQFGGRAVGGWPASEVGQLVGCVIGLAIALFLRAVPVAYLAAAFVAFSASELAIHLYYGVRITQGAPTHFAVIGAGILGVALGALLMTSSGRWSRVHEN